MNYSETRPGRLPPAVATDAGDKTKSPFLGELLRILARRRATIFLFITLSFIAAIAYLALTPPKFTSTTTMVLDTNRMPLFQNDQIAEAVDQAAVESQVETIQSEKVTSQVIKKLDLTHDPEFMSSPPSLMNRIVAYFESPFSTPDPQSEDKPEAAALRTATRILDSRLLVTHLARTYTVQISVTSLNKEKAVEIANEMAEAYINDQLEAKYDVIRRSGSWLQQRIEELREQASDAFKAVQDFRTENNIIVDSQGKLASDREINELTDALGRARTELATSESKVKRIVSILQGGSILGVQDKTVADVLNNPVITHLRTQYLDSQKRVEEWTAKYGKDHLATVNQRNEMAGLQRAILDEVARIAETYKSEVEIARSSEISIQKRLEGVFKDASSTRQSQIKLRELETRAATYQTIYENFLSRYTAAVQQQSFPSTEARVITPASLPDSKSSPKTSLTLFLSLLGGGLLGVGASAIQEHLDRVLRTRQQLEALGIDCLGVLPLVGKVSADPRELFLIHDDDPFSPIAEALREVKVAIDINQIHNKSNVIGIVSALPKEGKTTFSANLAQIIGKTGGKTLLIDGDLRNPALTRSLEKGHKSGLVEAIAGTQEIRNCVTTSEAQKFDFLGGTLQARLVHTADILSSLGMKNLIQSVRLDYEYIIIDLPPLLPLADVRGAAHLIDSFIFVANWGHTTIDDVKNALATSSILSERLLGAVLNKVVTKTMDRFEGYGRRSSAYYYGYKADDSASGPSSENSA
jgi:succinoglycan biosynthesis transport protein ExoP